MTVLRYTWHQLTEDATALIVRWPRRWRAAPASGGHAVG
jgi:hypothetical protein